MKKMVLVLAALLPLCGCWDMSQMKNLQMIDVIGLDKEQRTNQSKMSLAISSLTEAHQGGGKPGMELVKAQGSSLSEALENIDFETAGGLSFNQSRLYVLSKSFATDDPTGAMKVLGRLSTFPLTSSVAVYDGEVSELLEKRKLQGKTIANFLVVMLKQAEKINYVPKETLLRFILSKADPYIDMALPLIKSNGESVVMEGAALFREGNYTGIDLPMNLTKMAKLLKEGKGTGIYLIVKINGNPYEVWVKKARRDMVVKTKDSRVTEVSLPLRIQATLLDTHEKNQSVLTPEKLEALEKQLTEKLNEEAQLTVQTLQKANCDYFGIAREIHAYHNKQWRSMNWRSEYPKLSIKPEIQLQILNSGVMR